MFCVKASSFISYLSYMSALVLILNTLKNSCLSDEFLRTAGFWHTESSTLSAIVKSHFNMYRKHFGIRIWHLTNQIKKKKAEWLKSFMCLLRSNYQQAITIFAHLPCGALRFTANPKCIRILVSQVMTHVHIPGGPANSHWWWRVATGSQKVYNLWPQVFIN